MVGGRRPVWRLFRFGRRQPAVGTFDGGVETCKARDVGTRRDPARRAFAEASDSRVRADRAVEPLHIVSQFRHARPARRACRAVARRIARRTFPERFPRAEGRMARALGAEARRPDRLRRPNRLFPRFGVPGRNASVNERGERALEECSPSVRPIAALPFLFSSFAVERRVIRERRRSEKETGERWTAICRGLRPSRFRFSVVKTSSTVRTNLDTQK